MAREWWEGSGFAPSVRRCGDKYDLEVARTYRLPGVHNKRRFAVATFARAGANAPPEKWVVAVNHSVSSSEIRGNKKTKLKQDVLLQVVQTTDREAAADASTLGFVVLGDMNLKMDDIAKAMMGFRGVSTTENVDIVGAGVPWGSQVGVEGWGVGGHSPTNCPLQRPTRCFM